MSIEQCPGVFLKIQLYNKIIQKQTLETIEFFVANVL